MGLWLTIAKATPAIITIAPPALALPKIGVLLFYVRLNPTRGFRYRTFAVLALTATQMVVFMLGYIFHCRPVQKWWKPLLPGTCLDLKPGYVTLPIVNMCVEFFILLLQIPMLVKLQVGRRTKLVLGGIFAFSSCTVIVSAVRVWLVYDLLGSADFTFGSNRTNSTMIVEMNMTIIYAWVMVLRPFCRRHVPFLIGSDKSGPSGANAPDAMLAFDGPSGPWSKSNYRTKVSGGGRAANKRSGKRNIWPSMGSTLAVREDDDDMESLGRELRLLPPHVRIDGLGAERGANRENEQSLESIGLARSETRDPYAKSKEGEVPDGIVEWCHWICVNVGAWKICKTLGNALWPAPLDIWKA
ncbi:MAG: hypothetical protein Q9173_002686 [Seirophora scorigena]